jgi:hypothetical protein
MISIMADSPLQISSDNNIVVAVFRHDMSFISWCGNVLNIEEVISRGYSSAIGMEFYLRLFRSR